MRNLKIKNIENGFTLIEILAVVTIIGLLFILVLPKITNLLNSKKNDIDKTTKDLVISAAKSYVQENSNEFEKTEDNVYCLPIKTLTKKHYLDDKVTDLINKKDIQNTKVVKIEYDNSFKYSIVNKSSCKYL